MRKITLSLPDQTDADIRERAERAGLTVSAYVDRALRKFAADEDVALYEEWRESWSAEDKAIDLALRTAALEHLEEETA